MTGIRLQNLLAPLPDLFYNNEFTALRKVRAGQLQEAGVLCYRKISRVMGNTRPLLLA